MKSHIRAGFLIVTLMGCNSCLPTLPSFSAINHNPDLAATSATLFAKEAFIDLNQPGAYEFLTEEMQRSVSLEKFISVIAEMHPVAFPREVVATEYEPMLGQKSMFIWLYGENGSEKFYYRLTMAGTTEANYKVAGMFRLPELSPSQSRKPLRIRRTTAALK